jgi:hypothetical protein
MSGCAGSVPRLAPPADLSAADREACGALAEETKERIDGGSVWAGAAAGAVVGLALALYVGASIGASTGSDGPTVAAFVGSVAALGTAAGGAAGAGIVLARDMSVREAAYGDAMDACLRPALLVRQLGPEHLQVAYSLHALGYRYARQSKFAAAEPLYLRALAIQERTLGAEAPEVATTLYDYAGVLRQLGRAAEAAEVEKRAAAIRSKR